MTAIKDGGRLMSLERIALQAALNFSAQVVKMQQNEQFREEMIDSKIRMLADQLDDALKD
jgi:cell division protein ZapA (FtsZ GTPase activity inhibitor)